MADHEAHGVADAAVPADAGLSSLGLLMQLAGNVLAAYAGVITFVVFAAGGADALWMFLLVGLSIARSLLHRAAGSQLLYGDATATATSSQRMTAMRRYVSFALIQSVISGAILVGKYHAPFAFSLGVVGGLTAWPVTLAIVMALPRFRRFRDALPVGEDKGFEGASIVMTVFGLCALVATGSVLFVLLSLPGKTLQRGPGVLIVLALGMLCIRSVMHVQAGMSGLRETSVDRSVELANRYANFGVITAFCSGGALLLFVMQMKLEVAGLALVCGCVWMLMAWPLIVRRFFSDRQFAELLAGDAAPVHRRAPDAGLTGLGWLLVAQAVFTISFVIPELALGNSQTASALQPMFALGGNYGLCSMWWSIGLAVFQLWAGYELVRMSSHSRVVATVFGVVSSAVSCYINWPFIEAFRHPHLSQSETMVLAPVAISLVIPIATLVLVNRKLPPAAAPPPSKPPERPPLPSLGRGAFPPLAPK